MVSALYTLRLLNHSCFRPLLSPFCIHLSLSLILPLSPLLFPSASLGMHALHRVTLYRVVQLCSPSRQKRFVRSSAKPPLCQFYYYGPRAFLSPLFAALGRRQMRLGGIKSSNRGTRRRFMLPKFGTTVFDVPRDS